MEEKYVGIISSIDDIRKCDVAIKQKRISKFGLASNVFFRGHEDVSYVLKPTISRELKDVDKIQDVERFETDKVLDFLALHPNNGDIRVFNSDENFSKKWQMLCNMKHLDIPCRLLDVTGDIHYGVLFSVLKSKYDSCCGELFVFYCKNDIVYTDGSYGGNKDFRKLDPFDLCNTIVVNPGSFVDHLEDNVLSSLRKYKQYGRFIAQPTHSLTTAIDSNGDMIIERILIPSECKSQLREELREMGLCYETTIFREPTESIEELNKEITSMIDKIK